MPYVLKCATNGQGEKNATNLVGLVRLSTFGIVSRSHARRAPVCYCWWVLSLLRAAALPAKSDSRFSGWVDAGVKNLCGRGSNGGSPSRILLAGEECSKLYIAAIGSTTKACPIKYVLISRTPADARAWSSACAEMRGRYGNILEDQALRSARGCIDGGGGGNDCRLQ